MRKKRTACKNRLLKFATSERTFGFLRILKIDLNARGCKGRLKNAKNNQNYLFSSFFHNSYSTKPHFFLSKNLSETSPDKRMQKLEKR